uniref:spore germination protein n=1 Tax=Paenibacillus alkalitolerans TaxID=2799335 RepID=UPI002D8008AF|nr:spore germination protein [Paenibacillus alkalitolerans]
MANDTKIGRINIETVSGGVVIFGNTLSVSPSSNSKSVSGAGSSLTGDSPSSITIFNFQFTRKAKSQRKK